MNPSVEAAWIAASVGVLSLVGTVIIAIVGYRNTRVVAVEAARNERLVGKIADTYEGVVTALIRRQAERREAAMFTVNLNRRKECTVPLSAWIQPGLRQRVVLLLIHHLKFGVVLHWSAALTKKCLCTSKCGSRLSGVLAKRVNPVGLFRRRRRVENCVSK